MIKVILSWWRERQARMQMDRELVEDLEEYQRVYDNTGDRDERYL